MQQPKHEQNLYEAELYTVFTSNSLQAKVKAIRIRKPDGTHNLRLHVENNGILEPPLEFPVDKLRENVLKINNYSVAFSSIDIHKIIIDIKDKFMKEQVIPTLDAFDKIGWHYAVNENVDYWKSAIGVDLQGSTLVKDIYAPYPSYAGDLQANINYINNYISTHGVVAQSIILYGFSSILAGYFHKNLLLSLSGKSSRGKTIISKLLVSLFAEPTNEKLSTTFNVTLNKMAERLNGINGAAVLIDDLSLAPSSVKNDIDNMVYILGDGKEKERIRTKSFDRDPSTWATTIIFSAEESILAQCDPEHEGAVGRLMELNIGPDDLFSSANEASQIEKLSRENYGLLGDEFIKRLISNNKLNNITIRYEAEMKTIQKGYSGLMARIAGNVAIITLCGKLLDELFSLKFDIDAIKNYLLATAKDNLENFRILQKGNVIIETIYPELVAYAKEVCPNENQYLKDKGKDCVVISSKAANLKLGEIRGKYGYKPIDVKRTLKDNGLLYANDGPYSYNGTIGNKSFRGLYLYIKDTNNLEDTLDGEQ